jgi:hypothetical protein
MSIYLVLDYKNFYFNANVCEFDCSFFFKEQFFAQKNLISQKLEVIRSFINE